MRVRVKLLGSLKPPNMHGGVDVELPASSNLITLIQNISEKYPEIADSLRNPPGNLIMFEGIEVGNLEGLTTLLKEGSDVVFIPVTHGG